MTNSRTPGAHTTKYTRTTKRTRTETKQTHTPTTNARLDILPQHTHNKTHKKRNTYLQKSKQARASTPNARLDILA